MPLDARLRTNAYGSPRSRMTCSSSGLTQCLMTKKNNRAKCTSRTTRSKAKGRNDLLAALVSLVDGESKADKVETGYKTSKQFEDQFRVGPKQTYVWLERLTKAGLAEKKSYRVHTGMYIRNIPHYKLSKKASAVVQEMQGGR